MGKLGAGITLLVIGAVLTFAVNVDIPGIGKDALGVILMLGGALAIALWLVTESQRRRSTVVQSDAVVDEPVGYVDEGVRPVAERRRRRFF